MNTRDAELHNRDVKIIELRAEIDQLRHTCETQRVALSVFAKRGDRGFGSTDEKDKQQGATA